MIAFGHYDIGAKTSEVLMFKCLNLLILWFVVRMDFGVRLICDMQCLTEFLCFISLASDVEYVTFTGISYTFSIAVGRAINLHIFLPNI